MRKELSPGLYFDEESEIEMTESHTAADSRISSKVKLNALSSGVVGPWARQILSSRDRGNSQSQCQMVVVLIDKDWWRE